MAADKPGATGDRRDVPTGQAGWSLVELTLTLFLVSLLAALTAPAFVQLGDRLDRELFLGLFASDIRMARWEARSREAEVVLQLNAHGTGYRVKRGNQVIRRERVPPRYRMVSNYPKERVTFRRTGQVRGGTFWLLEEGERVGKVVIQVASGRSRVEVEP